MPIMPQDLDGIPPGANPAGTLIVPSLDGQAYAAAAGTRIIPSVDNGL